jgi:hypothetical protein
MRPGFPYVERCILRTFGIGVQKIPRLIYQLPIHDETIGVWCAISARRIIGSIFYDDGVNAARHVNNILSPFFTDLT